MPLFLLLLLLLLQGIVSTALHAAVSPERTEVQAVSITACSCVH